MKSINNGLWLIVLLFCFFGNAQQINNEILLTIDGKNYDAGTFIKFYLKNIDIVQDKKQKDINNYLELYIDYRLKLLQAYELELDKKDSYIKDIQSTRSNLAQPYLTDYTATESLTREAYERSKQLINASHILVKLSSNEAPADTLKAWNKIQDIYKELEAGANFGMLARTKSEGPSAGNEGMVGWFTSFSMVYEFETAAYGTAVGSYSKPFRTDFGYHIVHVNDKKPNPGQVTVAHIMTIDKKGVSENTAQTRIKELYQQLQDGVAFEELAREFSDDANSANRGGKLNKFGIGGIDETFATAALGIEKVGSYIEPVQTNYGWHIIKLLDKHPLKTYEEQEKELQEKIKKSPRSRIISDSFISKIKQQYQISEDLKLTKEVYPLVNESQIMAGNYVIDKTQKATNSKLFSIQETNYTINDFLIYLEQNQSKGTTAFTTKKQLLDQLYENFISQKVLSYYEDNLERDNEDFKFLYNEFKEGFLVFDLIETKIWNKANNDTIGQQQYYNAHKENYMWQRRLDIDLTQSTTEQVALEVRKMLQDQMSIEAIKEKLNTDNKSQVIITSQLVEETYDKFPKGFQVKPGVSSVYQDPGDNFYKVINVKEIIEPSFKSLEESRGRVINDYKQELEKKWINSLREGRDIKINKKTLEKLITQINKQLD
jgi:peptidyl-prolyl cis-trans isomerase SurA